VDDRDLTLNTEYRWITQTLRQFKNLLVQILVSWEGFETGEIQCFDVDAKDHSQKWNIELLIRIRKDIGALRDLQTLVAQRIEMFQDIQSSVRCSIRRDELYSHLADCQYNSHS
jgi:hypothetical protein